MLLLLFAYYFRKQEEDLLEEKELQQNLLLNAKKRFQTYEISKIVQSEEEVIHKTYFHLILLCMNFGNRITDFY